MALESCTSTLSAVLVAFFIIFALIYCLGTFLTHSWKKIRGTQPVWRNRYPSFEETHAIFDRGDIMMASVIIASALQISHPVLGKVLAVHSTFKINPWRRVIRTMTFIYVMIRSSSSERDMVIEWLHRIHRPIPAFMFEPNLVVFATFAFAMVRAHEFLGATTPEKVDRIVKGVMSLADKLDPNDVGREVPRTMPDLEKYLQVELSCTPDELLLINHDILNLSLRKEIKKYGIWYYLRTPFRSLKLYVFKEYVQLLARQVLRNGTSQLSRPKTPLWWLIRQIHSVISSFHYNLCPTDLTFNGLLDLMSSGNPRIRNARTDLYSEIFGDKDASSLEHLFSDLEAHLPVMDIDIKHPPMIPRLSEQIAEFFKCAYYRGKLAQIGGPHVQHLGMIMDGNRRYSKSKGFSNNLSGHQHGAHKLLQVITWSFSSGIQNVTVWALSDDNLKRGETEVNHLFAMMADYIKEIVLSDASFPIPDMRFRVVGDRSIIPDYLKEIISNAEAATEKNTRFNLQIAIGYGGRSEVTRAVKLSVKQKVSVEGLSLERAIATIEEKDISHQMYSAQLGLPQIDAIMRTSGENRLSGFALWESQYAEFIIVDENWPELRESTLLGSLLNLSQRHRRLGA